jgi:hypothetical protein
LNGTLPLLSNTHKSEPAIKQIILDINEKQSGTKFVIDPLKGTRYILIAPDWLELVRERLDQILESNSYRANVDAV